MVQATGMAGLTTSIRNLSELNSKEEVIDFLLFN